MTLNEKFAWLIKKCDGEIKVQYPVDVCGTPEWYIGVPAKLLVNDQVQLDRLLPDEWAGFAMETLEETVDYAIRELRKAEGHDQW